MPACAALNDVLGWGRRRPAVNPDGPHTTTHVDNADRRAAWETAMNYVKQRYQDPGRICRCAYAECGRYFFDTGSEGNRHRCSTVQRGNRTTAARGTTRSPDA